MIKKDQSNTKGKGGWLSWLLGRKTPKHKSQEGPVSSSPSTDASTEEEVTKPTAVNDEATPRPSDDDLQESTRNEYSSRIKNLNDKELTPEAEGKLIADLAILLTSPATKDIAQGIFHSIDSDNIKDRIKSLESEYIKSLELIYDEFAHTIEKTINQKDCPQKEKSQFIANFAMLLTNDFTKGIASQLFNKIKSPDIQAAILFVQESILLATDPTTYNKETNSNTPQPFNEASLDIIAIIDKLRNPQEKDIKLLTGIVQHLPPKAGAAVINNLPTKAGAAVLSHLPEAQTQKIMSKLAPDNWRHRTQPTQPARTR